MDLKILLILLTLCFTTQFFSSFAFAVDEYEIGEGDATPAQIIIAQKQEEIQRFAVLEQKLDEMMVTNKKNLEMVAGFVKMELDAFRTGIIITLIVIQLATMGLGFAFYFYFKSRGLI